MITDTIVKQVRYWLGEEGRKCFASYKEEHGTVSPVFMDGNIPHPVHFREGMAVRNFLRGLDDCKEWDTNQFDNNWKEVVERAIK